MSEPRINAQLLTAWLDWLDHGGMLEGCPSFDDSRPDLLALDLRDCRADLARAEQERDRALAALETAWAIIANAGGGDWTKETQDWQDAAARWRDLYHAILHSIHLESGRHRFRGHHD